MASAEGIPSLDEFVALSVDARVASAKRSEGGGASLLERVRDTLILGRPRTCVPGMLTYVLGAGHLDAQLSARTVTQAVMCFFAAFIANLENTYTDVEEDCRNLPGRVHVLVRLGAKRLLAIIAALHVAMLAAAALIDVQDFVVVAVGLVIVHQYSFGPLRAKGRPLVGLFVFALVVAYPFFLGLLADPELRFARGLLAWLARGEGDASAFRRYLAMGGFVGAWFVAKGTFKNVPDYHGDRAAGLRTSATVFGSWRAAAMAAAVATIATYASFGALVAFGLAPLRLGIALACLPVVLWNCTRLVRAEDGARGNLCLKTDMIISAGFMAVVVLLARPALFSAVAVLAGVCTIVLSDWLQVDSRRSQDARPRRSV